jgi:hypothetical protein
MLRSVFFIFTLCCYFVAATQSLPLGTWQVHVPYQSAVGVAISEDKIWGALEASVITVDKEDFSITKYTKALGLSDVEIAGIAYDSTTDAIIITYNNANIDIIQNNRVTNIPDVKNALITGDKTINNIHTQNGFAWLACGFGIVKVNIADKEISDTYFVGVGNSNLRINDVWANDDYVFAATEDGVLRGTISPFVNLSDADNPAAWLRFSLEDHNLPEISFDLVAEMNGKIFAAVNDELFSTNINATDWNTVAGTPANWSFQSMDGVEDVLYVSQNLLNNNNIIDARIGTFDGVNFSFQEDNNQISRPRNVAVDEDGTIWYADFFRGLALYDDNVVTPFISGGPYKRSVFNMHYFDGAMYIASSDLDPTLPGSDDSNLPYGVYISRAQQWENLNEFNAPGLVGSFDIADIQVIEGENKLLIGTDGFGIIEYDLNARTSIIYSKPPNENRNFRTIALTKDSQKNIWFGNAFSSEAPLACRKPGGAIKYFTSKTFDLQGAAINDITVDEFDQIWISTVNKGVLVYRTNGTLDDESDDELKIVGASFGLPSNDVRCVLAEKDGEIWIGTSLGVGVVFCPGSIFDNTCPVDRICIPRQDSTNFCDNLLENEVVTCMAIDPANRKWIGTNGGIFLQSADGLETIYNFTEDNSPLLSNRIRSVAVDDRTGDVYIGTDKGINTFRAEATLTEEGVSGQPYVYPNPVRPDYNGPIAIKNLANNGNVKILDSAGFIVFETESTGGTAVWDGLGENGQRVQSGVYIVLSADEKGNNKKTAKFVYIH